MEDRIRAIVEKAIADQEDLFLVDIKIKGNIGNQKILVFVDGDDGISIDQCGRISRELGAEMEETDLIEGKYTLEVSSPGLDFPLSLNRQYKKNIGRELSIDTHTGDSIEGELLEINDSGISIKVNLENRFLEFEEIKQSKVKVSFK